MARIATILALALATAAHAQPARGVRPPVQWQQVEHAIFLPPIVSPGWQYLKQSSVRTELSLTAAQKARLDLLVLLETFPDSLELPSLGLAPTSVVREAVAQVCEDFLTKTLTKEQSARLRQIEFQSKEREFGAHAAFAMSAKDVGLRPDQLQDVTSLKGLRVEEIAKLVTSGERFEKVKPKVEAANGDTYDKMT